MGKQRQMEPQMASKRSQNLIKNELETKSTKHVENLLNLIGGCSDSKTVGDRMRVAAAFFRHCERACGDLTRAIEVRVAAWAAFGSKSTRARAHTRTHHQHVQIWTVRQQFVTNNATLRPCLARGFDHGRQHRCEPCDVGSFSTKNTRGG